MPENFWKLVLEMERAGKRVTFNWDRVRLFDQGICTALYELCIQSGKAKVIHVGTKPKTRYRPFPLTTVKLQQLGAGKLRMSSERIMSVAEALYNQGLISYPRTETDAFAPGTPFADLIREQENDPQFGAYAVALNGGRFKEPKKGKNSDQAHTAIHPTKSGANLQGEPRRVYDLIARHFLACCSDDAKGSETTVRLEMGGEEFYQTGLVIHELNYLEVYPFDKWTDKDIPEFKLGEILKPKALALEAGTTSAPELLTEKDLITLMDKNGIGTDATIAQHIKKIQDRFYVVKQGQYFSPTKLGQTLVNGFDRMGFEFSQPNLRAQMEVDMKLIEAGGTTKQEAVQRNSDAYKRLYEVQQRQVNVLDSEFANSFRPKTNNFSRKTPGVAKCGSCQTLMSLVQQDDDQLVHCEPCNMSYRVDSVRRGAVVTAIPNKECPICNFQVLNVAMDDWSYTVCPKCKSLPPPEHFAADARNDCRGCTNAACDLAKGRSSVPLRACPSCHEHRLVLRSGKAGASDYLSCNAYPACKGTVSLPPCQSAAVSDEECATCSTKHGHPVRKIFFTFSNRRQAPPSSPTLSGAFCVAGCDREMNLLIENCNFESRDLWSVRKVRAPPPPVAAPQLAQQFANLNQGMQQNANSNHQARKCKCGVDSPVMTVKKEGANQGREFYTCATRTCDMFEWADEPPRSQQRGGGGGGGGGFQGNSSSNNNNSYSGGGGNSFSSSRNNDGPSHAYRVPEGAVVCKCNAPAMTRVTKKEGPNQGREFYRCGTPAECGFFQWADEAASGGGGGGGSSSSSSSSVVCYRCNQPGHFSNACPNGDGGGAPATKGKGKAKPAAKKRGRPAKKKYD